MTEIILYPTETVYGLGVNPLEPGALDALNDLKGRDEGKYASWLVKDVAEIEQYALLSDTARTIAEKFLPGPLTLVLPARPEIEPSLLGPQNTLSFRISPDPFASTLAAELSHPLTCTSANVSGKAPATDPNEILEQFAEKAYNITKVIDDGPRSGEPSTVVRVIDDTIEVIREGAISASEFAAK